MYSALYAKGAMIDHPACRSHKTDTIRIALGKPVQNEEFGVACMRSWISRFLIVNKNERIPAKLMSGRSGDRKILPTWEQLFESMKTDDVKDTYDERCGAIAETTAWGSSFELLVAQATGIEPRVVIGEDRKALKFQSMDDSRQEVLEDEPLIWYHSTSGNGKADHFDVLMSKRAARELIRRLWYPQQDWSAASGTVSGDISQDSESGSVESCSATESDN